MLSDPVVILTQEEPDNARLAEMLGSRGLSSFSYPCITTKYIPFDPEADVAGHRLADFRVIVFTSKRGAVGFVPAVRIVKDSNPLIACVGASTAHEVELRLGLECSITHESIKTAAGLAEAIIHCCGEPEPLLHVRGTRTGSALKDILETAGWNVSELIVYSNESPEIQSLEFHSRLVAVFASPSAAGRFFEKNESMKAILPCVAIGPVTGQALRSLGVIRLAESSQPELNSVAEAVERIIREECDNES